MWPKRTRTSPISCATISSTPTGCCAQNTVRYRRWLELVERGDLLGTGASELGVHGIGGPSFNTTLTPEGDGFVLNGEKYYSTGNLYTDHILVSAVTLDGQFATALVPVRDPGVVIAEDWDGIGQRQTASGTTVFTNVRIAAQDVVFLEGEDRRAPVEATFPQLYLSAIIAGILRAVVRDAAELVLGRGRNYYHAVAARPAEDPLLQEIIGRLASTAYVAEASVLRAAEALAEAQASAEAGLFREASLRAAKAKVVVDGLALEAATRLFDVGGASAATQRARLDRHWRNIRTISSHNPVAYKARALGDLILNNTPLPSAAFF
ncbi:acyl-CoA dehydrogenase family protein [Rhodobacter sp. 24-YEA-8]|uniref:acyl-CoA dehydrogenase family protein n=1 Tax=Rhodobacter sp. 24-YEA-8 TaxID=1884310 RepID=UPI00344FF664